jgi:hypothetical protein
LNALDAYIIARHVAPTDLIILGMLLGAAAAFAAAACHLRADRSADERWQGAWRHILTGDDIG